MARSTRHFSSRRIRRRRKRREIRAKRTSTEEKKGNDGDKNGDGGAKRGKKKRGGIDGYIPKKKEGDDFNNKKCKYMYILSFSKIIDTNYVLG